MSWKFDLHGDEVVGAEAGVDMHHARETLHGEAGADDKDEGDRNFGDDERLTKKIVGAVGGVRHFP